MEIEIDPNVSPALHPQSLEVFPEFGEDTMGYVSGATHALTVAYQAVSAVHKARDAARSNPTINEAAATMLVSDFARTAQERATVALDGALSSVSKGIAHLQAELNAPLQSSASSTVAAEIRSFVKALSTTKRLDFLAVAQRNGDETTLRAVLGAPPYLSGLTEEERVTRTNMFHMARDPLSARRLALMKQVKGKLEGINSILFPGVEKAMGTSWAEVRVVSDATRKAERAFADSTEEIARMKRFAQGRA